MAIIDRILVPTDFSDSSLKAYQFAEKIASKTGGVIDLVHIIPNNILEDERLRDSFQLNDETSQPDLQNEVYPLIFNEAELKLKSIQKKQFSSETRGEIFVQVDRTPAKAIAEKAWGGNYSMIIMSARGKHESGWFRGSTTEAVIRSSRVPVLSVYEDPQKLTNGRIVVPIDGSVLSMAATPAAAILAATFNAKITYLYVHEVFGFLGKEVPDKPEDIQHRRTADYLMNRLMDYLDREKPHGVHVIDSEGLGLTGLILNNQEISLAFEVISGTSAHHEITTYANEFSDLIVMTTHGRSGLAHMFLGSHAEKVALNTETSVLTVRPDSKLFDKQKN